jgi:hypothetical protein
MPMPQFITKFRRDRWRDQVIIVGKRLRELESARAGVDAHVWPEDTAYLDGLIDHTTRKRDRLLDKLKETA